MSAMCPSITVMVTRGCCLPRCCYRQTQASHCHGLPVCLPTRQTTALAGRPFWVHAIPLQLLNLVGNTPGGRAAQRRGGSAAPLRRRSGGSGRGPGMAVAIGALAVRVLRGWLCPLRRIGLAMIFGVPRIAAVADDAVAVGGARPGGLSSSHHRARRRGFPAGWARGGLRPGAPCGVGTSVCNRVGAVTLPGSRRHAGFVPPGAGAGEGLSPNAPPLPGASHRACSGPVELPAIPEIPAFRPDPIGVASGRDANACHAPGRMGARAATFRPWPG